MSAAPYSPILDSTTSPYKTNKAAQLLAESVKELMNSETYKAALRFRHKLHQYSFGNCFLIYRQCPQASLVAGYKRWQELGRQVKKGEKSIVILAPLIRKDKESDKEEVFGFRSTNVFDVSQTEGQAVPEYPKPQLLTSDSESIQRLLNQLESFATLEGFPITRQNLPAGVMGSFSHRDGSIALSIDAPPLQQLKTLAHELGHALMHQSEPTRPYYVHELEAESCAFLTCHALGLDTSCYSFPYLASWADDPAELLPAAERACKAADVLLEALKPPVLAVAA
jgi:antirestriction protein ArdC